MDPSSPIEDLNRRCGIPGSAEVFAGRGGLPAVRVTTAATAEIYLHGAQVTSWRPAGAEEVIFLSEYSHWQEGRAIRGGIPVCFPWFRAKKDDPGAPAHGLVRSRSWQLDSIRLNDDASVTIICSTQSDADSRRWWPHDFRVVHRITCGTNLRMELIVANTGSSPFLFEEALHTYFRVAHVQSARIRGLDGTTFLDNTDANRENIQSGELVIHKATDNAYLSTQSPAELIDPVLQRTIRTEKENSATTVVWNPGQQGAAALSDLGDQEWQRMVCIEASNILSAAISLAPGENHTLCATLIVRPDPR